MLEAVIFDMDGLLVDSEPYWDKARQIMAAEVNINWNEEDHKAVMGVSTAEWVAYMIKRLNLQIPPISVEKRIITNMIELYDKQIPFLPYAIESVSLSANNFSTGLASGSPTNIIETVTSSPLLKGKFDIIVSGDLFANGKPSPDIYLATAHQLNVTPNRCVCLEDSGNGILAGKRAGMKVIAVPDPRFPPSSDHLAEADIVLDTLKQFSLATIRQLNSS